MGNSQSSEAVSDKVARPALQARGLSSSSTATIKTSKSSSTAGKEGPRRRSIDLPDVYGGLALTPASPASPSDEMPSSSKGGWPRRGNSGRKGAAPSSKITKAGPTVSSTLASVASSGAGTSTSVSAPTTVVQPQAPTQSIGMALDAAESQAAYEAQMGIGEESRVDIDQAPEEVKEDAAQQSEGLAPALPLKGLNAFPILPLLSPDKATPPSLPPSLPVMPPPLTPPLATVVAPLIPASIVPLPLGTGASTTASLIVGQPLPIIARARTTSYEPPSPTGILELQAREPPRAHSPSSPPVVVDEAHAAGGIIPIGLPQANFPLPANYADAPVAAVMPAAAPIAGQNAALANDPQAQEAVIQATVDLEAGPDAVPTLITWRPVEGAGGEGTVAGSGAPPKSVYVTGTFSRGWSTKIEMRKKKSADDFTALVALPPGQHQLKFIVDKEWQTSRNLPSATDGEGNLINYLIVRGPTTPAPIYNMGWNEDADDGEEWGTEVPSPIAGLGAELDAWEAARDAQGKEVPRPYRISMLESLKPPLLPAPLKDVPLNKSQIVAQGSGDDNSILHKPDHSILDHLCASPISRGLLSVAATKRYRRKFVTIMYIRPMEKDGETAPTS